MIPPLERAQFTVTYRRHGPSGVHNFVTVVTALGGVEAIQQAAWQLVAKYPVAHAEFVEISCVRYEGPTMANGEIEGAAI